MFLGGRKATPGCNGLNDLLEVVHGKNAVVHTFSGKANSRAARTHLQVDQAIPSGEVKFWPNYLFRRNVSVSTRQIDRCG